MIFRKVSLLATILLLAFLGCDKIKTVLHPVDTVIPLSPETNLTLMEQWRVTSIDGDATSESLSRLQTLVAENVSEDINISFYGTVTNPIFYLNADGTWKLIVFYELFCDRTPGQSPLPLDPIKNSSLVSITLSVSGTYIAGFDTEKQSNVLIFETEKHAQGTVYHENPYNDDAYCPLDADIYCPPAIFYPAFTAELDWSIFDENPLPQLFSSALLDTETDTPVVYTWDMVTSEGTPEDYYRERGWGAGSDFLPEGASLVRWTLRLYSQGQENIVLRRTDL